MQAHRRKLIYRGLCNETRRSAESGFVERCGDINGGDIIDGGDIAGGIGGINGIELGD
jgi:hypothetical protein